MATSAVSAADYLPRTRSLTAARRAAAGLRTVHPAAILRAREHAEREAGFDAFVADLAQMRAEVDAR